MPDETIAVNRRARHDYAIEETLEAGIVLTGTEIKSVRAHKVNIAEAYARSYRPLMAACFRWVGASPGDERSCDR